jgi:hypothetical protein
MLLKPVAIGIEYGLFAERVFGEDHILPAEDEAL